MFESFKYAWDKLFLFMLFVSFALLGIEFMFNVSPAIIHETEYIDLVIIGGYYAIFIVGFRQAEKKLSYCKNHIWLIILLVIPLVPFARVLRLQFLEKFLKLGSNVAWHVLDQIGML